MNDFLLTSFRIVRVYPPEDNTGELIIESQHRPREFKHFHIPARDYYELNPVAGGLLIFRASDLMVLGYLPPRKRQVSNEELQVQRNGTGR